MVLAAKWERSAFRAVLLCKYEQEMLEMLEKQELEREEALKTFQATVAARSKAAGMQVVEENIRRQEREEQLFKLFQVLYYKPMYHTVRMPQHCLAVDGNQNTLSGDLVPIVRKRVKILWKGLRNFP